MSTSASRCSKIASVDLLHRLVIPLFSLHQTLVEENRAGAPIRHRMSTCKTLLQPNAMNIAQVLVQNLLWLPKTSNPQLYAVAEMITLLEVAHTSPQTWDSTVSAELLGSAPVRVGRLAWVTNLSKLLGKLMLWLILIPIDPRVHF